jgi:hypothetical protein
MGKRFALLAIHPFVSVNLLYAAIFLKFAGVPGSVTPDGRYDAMGRTSPQSYPVERE